MKKKPKEQPKKQSTNDVFSPDFESKVDPYFVQKAKEKDTWTRRSSTKIYGQWT